MGEISRLYAKIPDVQKSNSVLRIQRRKSSQPIKSPAYRILFLQRTIGNQAVQRLIRSGTLQEKLRIGQPGDKYEQEADRVADAVMRMPEPGVQRQPIEEEEEEQIQTKLVTEKITPSSVIQRQEPEEDEILQGKMSEVVQRQPGEEEELLQAKFASGLTGTLQTKTEASQNKTGMPDHLKSGLENLSSMNLSSVRVHHNSSKPAQLNALAYTQGQDIHVGPGQEKHLPHEGWHAVQQMQGRVKPTMQAKGVSINDDSGLEREADLMGTKALQMTRAEQATTSSNRLGSTLGHTPVAIRSPQAVQLFSEVEHLSLCSLASKQVLGKYKNHLIELAPDYTVEYGEMCAMADYFESLEQMRKVAKKKKGLNLGKGTRGELNYIRRVKLKGERFGPWNQKAEDAVKERHLKLATKNIAHFLEPVDDAGGMFGAQGAWKTYHLRAIKEAVYAGWRGESLNKALALEAFGGHFLTDAFSSGHIRTARLSVKEYWDSRVPLFFYNLQRFIAQRLAYWVKQHPMDVATRVVSVQIIYEIALKRVKSMLSVAMSFGDVVSLAIHDYFNKKGVEVTSGGKSGELYGDAYMSMGDYELAQAAVEAGIRDLVTAQDLAQQGKSMDEVIEHLAPGGPPRVYSAEKLFPVAKPDAQLRKPEQRSIMWRFATAYQLLNYKRFQKAVKVFGETKTSDLQEQAKDLTGEEKRGFKKMILEPFRSDTVEILRKVIDWTPMTGRVETTVDYFRMVEKKSYNQWVKGLGRTHHPVPLTPIQTLTVAQRVHILLTALGLSDQPLAWKVLTIETIDEKDADRVVYWVSWDRLATFFTGVRRRKFLNKFPETNFKRG